MPYVLAVVSKETGELIGDTGVNEVDGNAAETSYEKLLQLIDKSTPKEL